MGYFDDRRVSQADVYGIRFVDGEDSGVSVAVELGVSAIDGGDLGPSAMIQLFLPVGKDASLSSIEEEAVSRALDLLDRIVSEDRDAVRRLLSAPPGIDLEKR